MKEFPWLAALMQTADPLFPSGAYAHSYGLEELVGLRTVTDTASLQAFVREQAIPALAHQDLPYLNYAYTAVENGDSELLIELDHEICSWKLSEEIRNASFGQGIHRLRMLVKLWDDAHVNAFYERYQNGETPGNHIVVSALQYVMLKTPRQAALTAFAYQAVANYCSAAVKLIRIGPESCQHVLTQCLMDLTEAVTIALKIEREDTGWFSPTMDIASARHATAFSRLFIS